MTSSGLALRNFDCRIFCMFGGSAEGVGLDSTRVFSLSEQALSRPAKTKSKTREIRCSGEFELSILGYPVFSANQFIA